MSRPLAAAVLALALLAPAGLRADEAGAAVEEGNRLYAAGRFQEASEAYERAAALRPDAPEIAFNLGNAWYQRKLFDRALEHYHQALEAGRPELSARLHYNLGNTKYQQALEAFQSFQDAEPLVRAAIGHYRDSLALQADQPDLRYNLELAYRALDEIARQQTQPQPNARVRDQSTSATQGQSFRQEIEQKQSRPKDAELDQEQQPQGRQAQQSPQDAGITEQRMQVQKGDTPEQMSAEDAERLVEMMRERARASESQRREWRRARMRDAQVLRNW